MSYAQTLYGSLAASSGSSRRSSSPESLRFAHTLRSEHDAIMVGAGTVCRFVRLLYYCTRTRGRRDA